MSEEHTKVVGKNANANFGVRGWAMIIFGIAALYFVGSVQNESMNVVIPKLVEAYGWTDSQISWITTAGTIAGALCVFGWGPAARKVGPKKLAILMLAVVGICFGLTGYINTIVEYAIVRIIQTIGTVSVMNYFLPVLATNWFPTKKGVAMGYITIGNNLGSMIAIWLLTFMWKWFGHGGGFIAYGCIALIPILILGIALTDYPEQCGCYPDNDTSMTREEANRLLEEGLAYEKQSKWTAAVLLRTPQVWKVAVSLGLLCLTISGILTHLVAIFSTRGFSMNFSMGAMSVCSALAIPLSILLGVLDAKKGAKFATIVMSIVMTACFFISMIPAQFTVFFAGFAAAAVMGCLNNLCTSLPASIFGRYDMKRAQSVIIPIMQVLQAIGVGITGTIGDKTGGFTAVLGMMGICSVVAIVILLTLKDECIGRIE